MNLSKLKQFWQISKIPSKIALVIWEDSHDDEEDGKIDPGKYDNPHKRLFYMWEVGWVIKDDKFGVVLTKLYYFDGDTHPPTSIPRSAIKHMRYLK